AREIRRSTFGDLAGRLFNSLDKNADGKIERGEVEPRWQSRFDQIDRNGDGYIDDDEILWAINLWITGAIVPGTSQVIDDATILRLIDLWIKQAKV
ncbi:MAG: hypothetical protein K6T71_02500, partial [Candidatus Bipolaricaulota bacterium]|nr:hypothetical protein [Candidatus Bipolaricaulota bacterium]